LANLINNDVFIAAFTTANGRLRFVRNVRHIRKNLIYYNGDVLYIHGENTVKTGCLLGDYTDELGNGVWIIDWISIAINLILIQYSIYRVSQNSRITNS
jgi:hypothetical protein